MLNGSEGLNEGLEENLVANCLSSDIVSLVKISSIL